MMIAWRRLDIVFTVAVSIAPAAGLCRRTRGSGGKRRSCPKTEIHVPEVPPALFEQEIVEVGIAALGTERETGNEDCHSP